MGRAYQTDLSDAERPCLKAHPPTVPKPTGRPRIHEPRGVLDAILYVLRGGRAWRMSPHDSPPWKTVYHYFRKWRLPGTWERLDAAVRERPRASEEAPSPRRAASIPSRWSQPELAGQSEDATEASR